MASEAAMDLARRCGLAAAELDQLGKPSLGDEEQLQHSFESVSLILGVEDQGAGTLFVTSRQVLWACRQMTSAMAVPFTGLTMHAVASASEAFPRDSIYMQLVGAQAPLDDADDAAPEVRLVPADASAVAAIFQALCDGAAANPDEDMEDDEGDFFFDQDEVSQGAALDDEHAAVLSRFDAMLQVPTNGAHMDEAGQFDDAEESSDDGATPDCPCCQPR